MFVPSALVVHTAHTTALLYTIVIFEYIEELSKRYNIPKSELIDLLRKVSNERLIIRKVVKL